jgi:ribosome modulation factor
MSDESDRSYGEAYRAGYAAFVPDRPQPACPYPDPPEQFEWDRGWGDAHRDHLMRSEP